MILTKKCSACRRRFPFNAFANDLKKKDGKGAYCIPCKRIASDNRRAKNRERALRAKLAIGVCECHGFEVTKENHNKFEWDHINPQTKCHTIGKMLAYSDTAFYAELQKCRLVCVDWHRQHTRQQHIDGVFKIPEQQEIEYTPIEQVWQLSLFEER
jgi:hypothetical protein